MEKLGVFGGTFNPIHNGHLSLCTQLSDALGLAKVLLIPTAIPPHKRATELADGSQRLAMCRLAVQGHPRFAVCDLELRRRKQLYGGYFTGIGSALSRIPGCFLLMGTDMFLTVQNWYHANEIFRRAVLIAGARQKGEERQLREHLSFLETLGACGKIIPCHVVDISSTEIRAARKQGRTLRGMVPPSVARYIEENKLYLPKEGKVDGNS